MKRKVFTKEFKLEAVRLLESSGRAAAEVARELGIRRNQLYKRQYELRAKAEQVLGADRFRLSIHLTSLTHDLTNIAMQVAMDSYSERFRRDPLTGLNAVTSAGRPDWDTEFKRISVAHPNEPVDVYFCGPPALGSALREQCWMYGFFYHEQKF